MQQKFDFLIIGSGIAGLVYALKVADYGNVAIVTKSNIEETNTNYAQGGIAAVVDSLDSYDKHIQDTLIAGNYMNNEKIVSIVVKEAPQRINELISIGTEFDKNNKGNFDLAREGGHSQHRILHHKDNTGFEIERALVANVRNHKNIKIFENHFAIDLITQHHLGKLVRRYHDNIECYGAYVLDLEKKTTITFLAKITMMASGGTGNLYQSTTNPEIATGDGVAMVYRAKGIIENMEFIQFHPTALYNPGEKPAFLITEALRGYGAVLKTYQGIEFMSKYDKRESLAPRDIVARAIDNEMKISGTDHVYLDCRNIPVDELKDHFPNIYKKCLSLGINMETQMIPVVPAAHYQCGGIKVNEYGESWINNLFAAGEVASTGLHGANRLASNSLSEAAVFAYRAAQKAITKIDLIQFTEIPEWDIEGTSFPEEMVLITQNCKEMQQIMSNYVGIVRSNLRLERALRRLEIIYKETEDLYKKITLSQELCELRNLINVGYLITKMAQQRKESIGLHCNIDYPNINKNV